MNSVNRSDDRIAHAQRRIDNRSRDVESVVVVTVTGVPAVSKGHSIRYEGPPRLLVWPLWSCMKV